ncbi:PKD domain-containing protein [Candidatus Omnitrophota bacterium]
MSKLLKISVVMLLTVFLLPKYASAQQSWWDSDFQYRRQLTVGPADQGYSVKLRFDTATTPSATTLYAASVSTAKGDDFRIVYNGTELDRDITSFTPSLIEIWFKVQSDIATTPDGTSYILYYGNAAATNPPANEKNVYLWFDDFNRADQTNITIESAYTKTGGGIWPIENNTLKNIGGGGDPNKLIISALGTVSKDVDMLTKIKVVTFGGSDYARMGISSSMDSSGGGYCALFHNYLGSLHFLNDRRSWGTGGSCGWSIGTWYYMRFRVIDPISKLGKAKVWEVGTAEPSDWSVSGNFGSGSARGYGEIGFAGSRQPDTTYFDDILIRHIAEPEPAVSSGAEESTTPSNLPPTANATATPTSGDAPLAVAYTGEGADQDGAIASYSWDFGDGAISSEQDPIHTYASSGIYATILTVTDDQGATGSDTLGVTVTDGTGTTGGMPRSIGFQAKLKDYQGTLLDGTYIISFRIYDTDIGGVPLWEETQEVYIEEGFLDAELGSTVAIMLPFDKQYWLGVEIAPDIEMFPRFKFKSVPYSFNMVQ